VQCEHIEVQLHTDWQDVPPLAPTTVSIRESSRLWRVSRLRDNFLRSSFFKEPPICGTISAIRRML
jgi:hypothetical protein